MKKYVKEYKGHKVPDGATHWLVNGFAKWVDNKNISVIGCFQGATWKKCSHGMLQNAIELPEVEQEWSGEGLPPVGTVCEVNIGDTDVFEVATIMYISNQIVISSVGGHEFSSQASITKLRPLKTQQEKDREALFQYMRELQPVSTPAMNDVLDHYTHSLIDAGFTAPKATDNEQK